MDNRQKLKSLVDNTDGMALIEFALSLPVLLGLCMVGTEMSNMAFASQKLGTIASQTSDNISRYRNSITEAQVNDVFTGMGLLGDSIDLPEQGRIIVSSVQPITDTNGNVTDTKIRWQRCYGNVTSLASSYGTAGQLLGVNGIGPTGRKVAPRNGTEVIFVEVRYNFIPALAGKLVGNQELTALASMLVRERASAGNDLVSPGTASTC